MRIDSALALTILLFEGALEGQRTSRGPQQRTDVAGAFNLPAVTFNGVVKEITATLIVLDSSETQTVTIYRNHKTRFLMGGRPVDPKKIAVGTRLTLDVAKNPDGSLQAVNVMIAP